MGLFVVPSMSYWAVFIFIIIALMAFNEFSRTTLWGAITIFVVTPILLTIFVWPETCAMGNKYGTGNWFNWAKTYSALAGCLGFLAIRYIPNLRKKRWALAFPPFILAFNMLEACYRDLQVFSYGFWDGGMSHNLWLMSGPWNILNAIAGLLNILTICGWAGIFVSKDSSKDMIWPDMIWPWIICYDLWNFAYVYNCIPDHSFYTGLALLLSCTIPSFFIKKGAWLQHRAATLAMWAMFTLTFPQFVDELAFVPSSHSPVALFIVSFIAFISNIVLFIYQLRRIIKNKKNPLKDELYRETKDYKQLVKEN